MMHEICMQNIAVYVQRTNQNLKRLNCEALAFLWKLEYVV